MAKKVKSGESNLVALRLHNPDRERAAAVEKLLRQAGAEKEAANVSAVIRAALRFAAARPADFLRSASRNLDHFTGNE